MEKTPFVRHDMQKHEWEAIAHILISGHQKYGYSLQLSILFIASRLFGEGSITLEFFLSSLKNILQLKTETFWMGVITW